MPVLPSENRDAQDAASHPQQTPEVLDEEAAPHDDTTLKFRGRIEVTDEDAGGDPYNRMGRFRRVVR